MLKPGKKFQAQNSSCVFREIFNPRSSGLDYLSAGELMLQNGDSPSFSFSGEEVLLFNLGSPVRCLVNEKEYHLLAYDVLYVPAGLGFKVSHSGEGEGRLYVYRALGKEGCPVFHSRFEDAKNNKERIRHLDKKIVYKMFDVSEDAGKLMAGYTFYESFTRAWPPHNHTDQEEVYSFIEGEGAMSVYEKDENQTFVTSVAQGDHITIPLLNYHPVFSDTKPLCFIWCIAGNRYWIGDKNTGFMKGGKEKITT